MLRSHDDVSIVAECGDGDSALEAIDELQPDLVFLDIRMSDVRSVIERGDDRFLLGSVDAPSRPTRLQIL
jgi:DNA-binding NarL/FixJ family response regulator